jgi:DNA-directed RNA polymerase specialized sigma24 family protein
MTDSPGSETRLVLRLKDGESGDVYEEVWNRYFNRLVGLARKHLGISGHRRLGPEDVALDTLNSFFRRMSSGQFPDLSDSNGLRRLLFTIAKRKSLNEFVAGGRTEQSLSDDELSELVSDEPGPELTAYLVDLVGLLSTEMLRNIALMKLEGFTNGEIAAHFGVVERTVEYKLAMIRRLWAAKIAAR